MKQAIISIIVLISIICQQWNTYTTQRDVVSLWKYNYNFFIKNQKLSNYTYYGIINIEKKNYNNKMLIKAKPKNN